MSIFSKKFDDITFEDVKELVDNKKSENEVLDYKEKWGKNEDIAKLVSALANTYGGWIIFGVREEKDTNKPAGFNPLKLTEKDLDHKLDSICYDLISPPITTFQTKHLADPQGNRVFIVNVPESDLTPHAVEDNTTVYIKVRSQKRKMSGIEYEKADLGTVEALKHRRQRHVDMRVSLLNRIKKLTTIGISMLPNNDWYSLRLTVSPKYPRRPLAETGRFYGLVEGYRSDYFNDHPRSVIHLSQCFHYDGGIVLRYHDKCPEGSMQINEYQEFYLHVNLHNRGVCEFYVTQQKRGIPVRMYLSLRLITGYMITFLDLAFGFLGKLDYRGSLMLQAEINGLLNTKLLQPPAKLRPHREESICTLENTITLDDEVITGSTNETVKGFTSNFLSRLVFVYNERNDTSAIAEAVFDDTLPEYRRP